MYLPPHFEETDEQSIRSLIADFPLGTLITMGPDGICANHTPFLLEPRGGDQGTLIGHVARKNPVWRDYDPAIETLTVFQGPAAYISPNWHPTKQQTHEVVPTYNYAVVHVSGHMVVHEDAKWLRGVVGKLTKTMESAQPSPWRMADAPGTFIAAQLDKIVGIEIPISRVLGKWKQSQNRPVADKEGAAAGLRASGNANDAAVAALILERMEVVPFHVKRPVNS